jgi:Predicted O-methyltransferase
MAHELLRDRLATAKVVVDATAGNGRDTFFLAANTPANAVVWALDLQPEALAATGRLLATHGLAAKCRLINACHSQLDRHVPAPVDAAMFNLGYRPGGDHSFTTQAATTVAALERLTVRLAPDGLISIVAYPGHAAGKEENTEVANYLATLPQTGFTVACWRMLNQKNEPPILYIVSKTGREPV